MRSQSSRWQFYVFKLRLTHWQSCLERTSLSVATITQTTMLTLFTLGIQSVVNCSVYLTTQEIWQAGKKNGRIVYLLPGHASFCALLCMQVFVTESVVETVWPLWPLWNPLLGFINALFCHTNKYINALIVTHIWTLSWRCKFFIGIVHILGEICYINTDVWIWKAALLARVDVIFITKQNICGKMRGVSFSISTYSFIFFEFCKFLFFLGVAM